MYIKPEPGIYQLLDEYAHEIYVGVTKNLQARKRQHYYDLRKNRHRNPKVQIAYNSKHSISFAVLEYLPITSSDDFLIRREQEWMDFLQPTLNSRNAILKFGSDLEIQRERKLAGASGRIQTEEEKIRRAESVKLYWKHNPPKKMPIEFVERLKERMKGEKHHNWGKETPQKVKDQISDTLSKYEYVFISPTGDEVTVSNLRRYINETKLWQLYKLAQGKFDSYKGWKFVEKKPRPSKK